MQNRLAEFRAKRGMTQDELAAKAGVSRPYISEIETGSQQAITNVVMGKLSEALEESVVNIFFTPSVVCTKQPKATSKENSLTKNGGDHNDIQQKRNHESSMGRVQQQQKDRGSLPGKKAHELQLGT